MSRRGIRRFGLWLAWLSLLGLAAPLPAMAADGAASNTATKSAKKSTKKTTHKIKSARKSKKKAAPAAAIKADPKKIASAPAAVANRPDPDPGQATPDPEAERQRIIREYFQHRDGSGHFVAGGMPAAIPQPLTAADIGHYQRAIAAQSLAQWSEADRELRQIGNKLLVGNVLYQRYAIEGGYSATFPELLSWMVQYAELPGASRIYQLAMARRPKGGPLPPAPPSLQAPPPPPTEAQNRVASMTPGQRSAYSKFYDGFNSDLSDGKTDRAAARLRNFEETGLLTDTEADNLRGRVASAYFYAGEDRDAYRQASRAASRSRDRLVDPDWIAGMAAWRLRDTKSALVHFGKLSDSTAPYASAWIKSAAAFWASRAAKSDAETQEWLRKAAQYPRTFYGLLALRKLGQDPHFIWSPPPFNTDHYARLQSQGGVQRAIALAQVGQPDWADLELRQIWDQAVYEGRADEVLEPLIAMAVQMNLPATQVRLARKGWDGLAGPYDAALYPLPRWQPAGGFQIDRSVIYAFMRQESAFNAYAVSSSGARGLMQLMPATAGFVSGDATLSGRNQGKLFKPDFNLWLGQSYLKYLMDRSDAGVNLMWLATAYNAGPGNLKRWLGKVEYRDDPLLFTEAIPAGETRNYIERVLSNYWIYQIRMGQPTPSLDALATGKWPTYQALDTPDAAPTAASTPAGPAIVPTSMSPQVQNAN